MKFVLFNVSIISILIIVGCNGNNNPKTSIWDEDDQYILIVQHNGNVMPRDNRYTVYDYSRTALPAEAMTVLHEIHTTDENLEAWQDGTTFKVIVRDNRNFATTYLSSNQAYERNMGKLFIALSDIIKLTELLEGTGSKSSPSPIPR